VETAPDGRFLIDDQAVALEARETIPGRQWSIALAGRSHEVTILGREPLRLLVDGVEIAASAADERALAAARSGGATRGGRREVRAPMPGLLKAVHVSEGDVVERGDALVTLEAMKMENELRAPERGTVVRVAAAPGAKVEGGALLVVVAARA